MSEVTWHGKEFIRAVEKRVKIAIRNILWEYERKLQELFRLPKTGRVYGAEQEVAFTTKDGAEVSFTAYKGFARGKKGRKGKVHVASAPGEAPAIDTKRLAQSVLRNVAEEGNMIVGRVGTDVHYAERLEFGTTDMEARPAWGPALDQVKGEIQGIVEAAFADMPEGGK